MLWTVPRSGPSHLYETKTAAVETSGNLRRAPRDRLFPFPSLLSLLFLFLAREARQASMYTRGQVLGGSRCAPPPCDYGAPARGYLIIDGWPGCKSGLGGSGLFRSVSAKNTDFTINLSVYGTQCILPQSLQFIETFTTRNAFQYIPGSPEHQLTQVTSLSLSSLPLTSLVVPTEEESLAS